MAEARDPRGQPFGAAAAPSAHPPSAQPPAWYAASPGKWRDWLTVLHPPYTAWHLSYVLIGAAMAPRFHLERLLATLIAFGLAVGVGAHGLDELRGRPLRTRIPSPVLACVSIAAICGAVTLGALGIDPGRMGPADFHPDRCLPGHRLQPGAVARPLP